MKVLIIGNGATSVDNNQRFFINSHTGQFLQKIQIVHEIHFAQNSSVYNRNSDLHSFELKENNIGFSLVQSNKSLSSYWKNLELVRRYDFVYIFFPGTLGRIIALLCKILKKPYAFYIRGQFYNSFRIDRHLLKGAKFILTVSPLFAKDLKKYCPIVKVIKPMINIGMNDINKDRKYSINATWKFLFVGRLEERKGIFDLIEIAQYLKISGLNFKLNVVGGGDLYEEVNTLLEKSGLLDHVKLFGQISEKEDLKILFNEADAFIFTSHDEGFPRVLYEAMASGLPIFTTFVGGIPGRMNDQENCIEIPLRSGKKASEIIMNNIIQDGLLQRIGEHGRETMIKIIEGEFRSHEELLIEQLNVL